MMSKKVTIVIPNYNGLAFMEDCMAALEAQTCKEFEVLVAVSYTHLTLPTKLEV